MDCDICSREFSARRKPLCPSCAQVILYSTRVQQATSLLDREKSHTHAEAVIRPGNDGVLAALPADADFDAITEGIKANSHDRTYARREATDHRIHHTVEKADELKKQLEEYKEIMQAQRQDMDRRRKQLEVERIEFAKAKTRASEPVQSTITWVLHRAVKTQVRTSDARHLLLRELASANGLYKRKNAHGRSEYVLGGLAIPNLRDLNLKTQAPAKTSTVGGRILAEPHDLVSESLDNVARLLNLCTHYLSVRLPAELVPTHEDFPRTAIMPEKSSYKYQNVGFPVTSSASGSSPAASKTLDRDAPRPRPLWIDRPLAQLYKEDVKTYGLFIEGVTLLAWNLAWLCKTQGIDTINSFDDICAVGRNLWHLFMVQSRRPQTRPALDRKSTATSGKEERGKEGSHLGLFSHSSAQQNLAGFEGLRLMKDWKFASPARFTDKLKSHLITEIAGAEWDLLEEQEWDDERDDEKPVFVGGSRRPLDSKQVAMSIMSVAPHEETEDEKTSASDGKRKGNSGWMKVRGRTGDA